MEHIHIIAKIDNTNVERLPNGTALAAVCEYCHILSHRSELSEILPGPMR